MINNWNHWKRRAAGAALGITVFATGCAADPVTPEPASSVPGDVEAALMPPVGLALSPLRPREKRFDVKVQGAPAEAFFMSLVEGTPYNMVVQPGVTGTITLNLRDVTVPEVMSSVREAYGYDWRPSPTGFVVLSTELQSRVFKVDYLRIHRTGRSRIIVSSGNLTERGGSGGDGGGGSGGGSGDAAGGGRSILPSATIETQTDSDFWADLDSALKLLVPAGNGRSIVTQPDSGLVVVRAPPPELRMVANFLTDLHGGLQRQVILEAKIVEVSLSEGYQTGINWATLQQNNGETTFGGLVGGQSALDTGFADTAGAPLLISAGNPVTGFESSAIGGALLLAADLKNFNAVVEALGTQGDVRVLSSPRVSTMNNQKAIIKVGSDEFFVTGVRSDTTTGAATTTNRQIELTPFFSGIALDVTPQIDASGMVTLHVHPTVSEVRDQIKTLTVDGQTQTLPLALSNVREADSVVRAQSGQIVVIGGLMQDREVVNEVGIPLLKDIPLLGAFFKQSRKSTVKSELVIMLKPIVVDDPGIWNAEIERRRERLRQLGLETDAG